MGEMFDLWRLPWVSSPGYVTRQTSSYDRASKSATDNWFANADYGKFVREETNGGRREWVMADLTGPGAVVRIWSANPQGTIRFYFDDEESPRIEESFEALTSGKLSAFPEPLSHRVAMGANLYFSFPYEKTLKITVDDSGGAKPSTLYYHVTYRTYEPAIKVETYRGAAFRRTDQEVVGSRKVAAAGELRSGSAFSLDLPGGSGAIYDLRLRVSANEEVLRNILLEAEFDGVKTIACPVGDFFGSAPGIATFETLPLAMDASSGMMRSSWVMPQKSYGWLRLVNHSSQDVEVSMQVKWKTIEWTDDTMYFHAKWRSETMLTRPMRDWNILSVSGEGRFVGCALYVSNPTRAWWGEGDEKIYIDGETFPSTFGTGTEDYFGYAWCNAILFSHPFHSQPRADGPANRGYIANNRFHVIDDMPFTSSFRFDMEIWHWAEVTADFATVAYWYAKPGAMDGFEPIRAKDLYIHPLPIFGVAGAIEGEELKLIESSGGVVQRQGLDDRWSRDEQVWWRDGAVGDVAKWEVRSENIGRLRLIGRFTEAVDYGIVQLYWNGERLGDPIDFYSPGLGLRTVEFGEVVVREINVLEVRIVGTNGKAMERYMFGIDYFMVGEGN